MQLKSIDGYCATVFDGHGGWQMAEYASEKLSKYIDDSIKENLDTQNKISIDEIIKISLENAYDKVENSFLKIALDAYNFGFPQTARVGSCALTAIIYNNKIFAANAGDCKGVICSDDGKNGFSCRKINSKLNASSKKEQKRLKEEFPNDSNIFVCKKVKKIKIYLYKLNIFRMT